MVTNLGSDILVCLDWDEKKLFSLHVPKLKPPDSLPHDIPFAIALQADAVIPPCTHGRINNFVDYIATIGFLYDRWDHLCGAAVLVLFILARHLHPNEPAPRDDVVSMSKLMAEGSHSEQQIVLG